jgi:hypothetical protein
MKVFFRTAATLGILPEYRFALVSQTKAGSKGSALSF